MVAQRRPEVASFGNLWLPEVASFGNLWLPEVANLAASRLSECCHNWLVTYLTYEVLFSIRLRT